MPISAYSQVALTDGIAVQYELQVSSSSNKTPLWLNANKYGLSSLDKSNGYVRAYLSRDLSIDQNKTLGIGYGIDVAAAYNYSSNVIIQQLYAELGYHWFTFSIGSKQRPMEMKNQQLSSGSQTFGINARPVPQLRVGIDEYKVLPFANNWIAIKGHLAYGFMTDGKYQRDFTRKNSKWAEKALYHSKAGYLKIGRENKPISFELGLEMASIFGGTANWYDGDGKFMVLEGKHDLPAFWHAFIPGGSDFQEEEQGYVNVEGNQLGSWLARLNYDQEAYKISFYADHFFEDHSALYQLGYYGYGKDGDWTKRNRKLYLYPLKDGLIGFDVMLKTQSYLKNIVLEFINTRFQSGPIYHDHTQTITDQLGGWDDYYNHTYYSGWQYYGQVIGNPLYRSSIYNEGHSLTIEDNRFFAWHIGLHGEIGEKINYRLLTTWQKGYGTYRKPFDVPENNLSIMTEADYDLSQIAEGFGVRLGLGLDQGNLLGDNFGVQLTIKYCH